MSDSRFSSLADVIDDELFPDVDLALRRGRHIDREDAAWYSFLSDAQEPLQQFYRRYGCELVHPSEGYFYLLPTADRLGKRHLSVPEMLVGQTLALLYLDPSTVQQGGATTRSHVLSHLASVLGADALTRAMNPKRKRVDERVAEEQVRSKFGEALRRLAALGFIELLEGEGLRLRSALMRFAEPVRGHGSATEALEQLVARGEIVMGTGDNEEEPDELAEKPAPEPAEEPEREPELPEEVKSTLADLDDFAAVFDAPALAEPEPPQLTEPAEPSERPEPSEQPEPEDDEV